MPIGIFADVASMFIGGLIGTFGGKHLPDKLKEALPMAFALASMAMGIVSLVKMQHLPVVVLALILGTAVGTMCELEKLLRHAGEWAARQFMRGQGGDPARRARNLEYFAIAVILFCTGPTGIFGVMQATMTGDNSLLFSKCGLDLFTAAVFAANAGIVISLLAIPVFGVFSFFYLLSGVIAPILTPAMMADFSGCGGVLILAVGFRMAEIKMFRVTDMLPSMLFVMPLTHVWEMLPF